MLQEKVLIREVGPRDGLQNEKQMISTKDKVAWINQLSQTGLSYIEVTSFVHPKWIPALADSLDVVKQINRQPGVTYAALVPNQRGLESALEANIDEVSVFMSASDTHNKKNINKSMDETFPVLASVVSDAKGAGKSVRGYISTVFGCPYEGHVSIDRVVHTAEKLMEMGIDELSLGDTIGVATPNQIEEVIKALTHTIPIDKLALHVHDTRGTALANVYQAYQLGVRRFDGAVAGLGGCPYAPGAAGNVATEDMIYLFNGLGVDTDVSLNQLLDSAEFIHQKVGRALPSHNLQARLASGSCKEEV
ncbi:hydroxymethylglutaryl-CoA lyase [Alkalihalophilus lindianensis]|uniref:Hydroxymethylglutaryl-CoA lyase n=1 Tax=Alkalihalophilus lindianensis TaxID=1630542 RepID=A0ABU3XEC6_9BACI|nr:hydroxymethylglutaryl-CoA lyase [Alkalihalophilus lindianensis]MDV2686239.1 hydroxymethylglutaryl-CoA lyase [Alkalihalophilus lindianensis]